MATGLWRGEAAATERVESMTAALSPAGHESERGACVVVVTGVVVEVGGPVVVPTRVVDGALVVVESRDDDAATGTTTRRESVSEAPSAAKARRGTLTRRDSSIAAEYRTRASALPSPAPERRVAFGRCRRIDRVFL